MGINDLITYRVRVGNFYFLAMTSFARTLTEKLQAQAHKRVLTTDAYLHLNGVEDNSIYALGDCATIENPKLIEHIMEVFEEADV